MTPGQAIQAQAAIDDGWPYPDNDSDLKEDNRAALEDDFPEEFEGLLVTDLDDIFIQPSGSDDEDDHEWAFSRA